MKADEDRALELLHSTWFIRREIAVGIVLAFIKEIRAEAADRAVAWYNEPDVSHEEKYDDDEYWNNALRAAIMGGKE